MGFCVCDERNLFLIRPESWGRYRTQNCSVLGPYIWKAMLKQSAIKEYLEFLKMFDDSFVRSFAHYHNKLSASKTFITSQSRHHACIYEQ